MKTKQVLKNILIYLAAITVIALLGGIYLVAASWLISGMIGTTFTTLQALRLVALVFLTTMSYKFIKSIKVEN